MRRSATLAEHAQLDIDEARRWYERRGGALLAQRFVEAIDVAIARIEQFPENHPVVHGRLRRARRWRFPYMLLFIANRDQIVVHRCVHLHRDPMRWRTDFG